MFFNFIILFSYTFPAYQTDFSVTTRLLPNFSNSSGAGSGVHTIPLKPVGFPSSPGSSAPPPPLVMPHGWQGYIPPTFPHQWQQTNADHHEGEPLSSGVYVQQSWKPLVQDNSGEQFFCVCSCVSVHLLVPDNFNTNFCHTC